MIDVKTLEIAGFRSAFEALRLPYSKECRSITDAVTRVESSTLWLLSSIDIREDDLKLIQTLIKRGDEHAKPLRGIMAYAKVTAPLYWWSEMETYTVGHTRLFSESTMHTEGRGLSGEELQRVKAEIPSGRMITKIDCFNYQCLRHIYFQRRNHRLPEWHMFCEWIETLPLAAELITIE